MEEYVKSSSQWKTDEEIMKSNLILSLVSKKNSVIKRKKKKVNFSGEIFGEENFASSISKLLPRVFPSFSRGLETIVRGTHTREKYSRNVRSISHQCFQWNIFGQRSNHTTNRVILRSVNKGWEVRCDHPHKYAVKRWSLKLPSCYSQDSQLGHIAIASSRKRVLF